MNTKNIKSMKIRDFLTLLWFVVKISLISFGGGNSLMPIIYSQAVVKKGWISKGDFDQGLILTNLLPGPSSLQMMALVCIKKLGPFWGVIATVLGIFPHILLFFTLFILVKNLPPRYLVTFNLAIFSTIIGILLGFCYIYWKKDKNSKNKLVYYTVLLLSFAYCLFVPSPYNLAIVPILVIIFIYSILFLFKKWKKNRDFTS
ncbi:chromate transporter [Mesomycoplasma ovipneumoniae]|nr:chromate transporter [Mesomycoplasma ovipneumoniae]